ncbi:zinc finger, c4 type (two domains) domain-containing protein [Ditylenchus destructor]|nr:zinc finger, c4 type (two domains) domain-containing protein [Ditylenchus destructor]
MQAINNPHRYTLNNNAFGSTTSHESLYSAFIINPLSTPVDFLGPTKTVIDSEYLTFTSGELSNGQLKLKTFAQNMDMPRKCLVCGHPTNCCHYDVPSCNGCKTFFRRYLVASKSFTCQFNEMCDIVNGIDQCRACRFDRCILAGMNPRLMRFPTSVDVAKFSYKVSNRRVGFLNKMDRLVAVF